MTSATGIRILTALIACAMIAGCGPRRVILGEDEVRRLDVFAQAAMITSVHQESHPTIGEFVRLGVEEMARYAARRGYEVELPRVDPGVFDDDEAAVQYFHRCYRQFTKHTRIPPDSLVLGAARFAIETCNPNGAVIDSRDGVIGATIAQREKGIVVFPAPGSPAHAAGVRSGDLVVAVDGHRTAGASLARFVEWARGPAGSECTLEIRRPGVDDLFETRVVRSTSFDLLPALKTQLVRTGVGYVKLRRVDRRTGVQLVNALESLRRDEGIQSLILDLREVGPARFEDACAVIDVFLATGRVAGARWNDRIKEEVVDATGLATLPATEMIALVGPGTSFAGELIAGALQESGRATLLGMRTAGAGLITRSFPIGEHKRLWMPVGRYLLPSGRSFGQSGVEPDLHFAGAGREAVTAAADSLDS